MRAIIPSTDSKTTMFPGDRNTFGLLPGLPETGGSCAFATTGCGGCMETRSGRVNPTCYVFRVMSFRPAVAGVLKHNTELLMSASADEQVALLCKEFSRYHSSWSRYSKWRLVRPEHGAETPVQKYRIHWSGDCFDNQYARSLRAAMAQFEGRLEFWGYSRALFTVPVMLGLANCRWLVSTDDTCWSDTLKYLGKYHPEVLLGASNVTLAHMSSRTPESGRYLPCPTNRSADSAGQPHEGACYRCGQCLRGEHIWFETR